jgi:hypothetical protein
MNTIPAFRFINETLAFFLVIRPCARAHAKAHVQSLIAKQQGVLQALTLRQ